MKASALFLSILGAGVVVTCLPHEATANNEAAVFDTDAALVPIFDRRGVRILQTRVLDILLTYASDMPEGRR